MSVCEVIKKTVDGGIASPPKPSCPFLSTEATLVRKDFSVVELTEDDPGSWSRIHLT